jgi:hypothetical protein
MKGDEKMNPYGIEDGPIETREIRRRDRREDPLATTEYNGNWYTAEEAAELQRRHKAQQAAYIRENREKWEQTAEGKLCLQFYDAFQAYKKYLEENKHAVRTPHGCKVDYDEHKLFEEGLRLAEEHRQQRDERLRRNLEKAKNAARCRYVFLNGDQCAAPRVKGKKLCRMHERMEEAKAQKLDLGPMEDPDSIQVGIRKLQAAIIDGKLDSKQIGHLAYTIQLAAWMATRPGAMQYVKD